MADELDSLIHQPTRLRLMTLLYRNREEAFSWLQGRLGLTPGNLDSHVQRLSGAGYVVLWRALTPSGFQNRVRITPAGDAAFRSYLAQLRAVLEETDGSGAQKSETEK